MVQLTDSTFNDEIVKSKVPVLVDFWATWCMPCQKLTPILEELSHEYDGKIRFAKVNVEEGQATASRLGIMSVPTIIIFKDGKIKEQLIGLQPKDALKKRLDAVV